MQNLSMLAIITLVVLSCNPNIKTLNEKDEIFHAGPSSNGIGLSYFALYNSGDYMFCNSGGIGEECKIGHYILKGDTISLQELTDKSFIQSNRLIILRYAEQDSAYWKWKYNNGVVGWKRYQWSDTALGGTGDVYQLDSKNIILKNEQHFIVRLDRLK